MTWTESFDNVHLVITFTVVTNWVWVGSVSNRIGFTVNREEAYRGINEEHRTDYWNPILGNYENRSTFVNTTNLDEMIGSRLVALNGSIVNERLFWRSDMVGILGTNANVPVTNVAATGKGPPLPGGKTP